MNRLVAAAPHPRAPAPSAARPLLHIVDSGPTRAPPPATVPSGDPRTRPELYIHHHASGSGGGPWPALCGDAAAGRASLPRSPDAGGASRPSAWSTRRRDPPPTPRRDPVDGADPPTPGSSRDSRVSAVAERARTPAIARILTARAAASLRPSAAHLRKLSSWSTSAWSKSSCFASTCPDTLRQISASA